MIIKSGYQIGFKALQELADISIDKKELNNIYEILKKVIPWFYIFQDDAICKLDIRVHGFCLFLS